ncbi:MAG: hypothetical protein EHM58_15610 [Ignavibacteriae bacterium]|nr:MAG: hypothetical protein EHM58_15610 [Ignavibacteriota bacterium]
MNGIYTRTLEVSLQKTKFKVFEPIEMLVKYINNGAKTDSLYYLFDINSTYMKYVITGENGKIINRYDNEDHNGIRSEPLYIVNPGDTILSGMWISYYGRRLWDEDSIYFKMSQIPIGKYKMYLYSENDIKNKFDPPLVSNTVEFEVVDINEQDRQILHLYKQGKFEEINWDYKQNDFLEYVNRIELRDEHMKIEKGKSTEENWAIKFSEFMDKYPNSLHTIYHINHYMRNISQKDKINIYENMEKLIEKYPNTLISMYLSNRNTRERLANNIIKYKK